MSSAHKYSELSGDRSIPQAQFRVLSQSVRLYILPDKIASHEIQRLYTLAQSLGALRASSFGYANLLLTTVRAPKRVYSALRREQGDLSDEWMSKLDILATAWLETTAEKGIMQAFEPYRVALPPGSFDGGLSQRSELQHRGAATSAVCRTKRERSSDCDDTAEGDVAEGSAGVTKRYRQHGAAKSLAARASPPWKNSEVCCERPTPLFSVHNQALVDELEVIRKQRELTSQQWSERSYGNCLSAIKAFPEPICSQNMGTVRGLKGVGQKMIGIIEQFCEKGFIVEAKLIRSDPANQVLFSFMDLYGVGPVAARTLYEQGCRTIEDVIRCGKSLATQLKVEDCYRILPDLKTKIPRYEVEEIARLVHDELLHLVPDAFYTICGGYRRGKTMTNDVDLVITSKTANFRQRQDVIRGLLDRMKRKGLMSHTVNVMHGGDGFSSSGHIDIAEIVVLPPRTATISQPRHRRVDLIFCAPHIYGAAVLGWTGSKTFEKDLRRVAARRGYKFHSSGLIERDSGKLIDTETEAMVFARLGLVEMPPELRNCDA
ncbi:unnamed protein product [Parajaminaea phylloscopi]